MSAIPVSQLPASVRAKLPKRGKGKKTLLTENAKRLREATEKARQDAFFAMLAHANLPAPTREVQFHPSRKWRFDFAWVEQKVALEVEGGVFIQGRHSRGAGMLADMQKYNAAAVLNWKVLRITPDQLTANGTEEMLRRCLR